MKLFLLDSFSATRFRGNPAAVCMPNAPLPAAKMQALASELALPVTAFVEPAKDGVHPIRYFTRTMEIAACGHASLAASFLVEDGARFRTTTGVVLQTRRDGDAMLVRYPRYVLQPMALGDALRRALGIEAGTSLGFCAELDTLFVELADAAQLRGARPDFAAMLAANDAIHEVVLTSAADEPRFDYLLRSFCPWIGIDEDPVTGSVHAALAPVWSSRLGKTALAAHQASERGGEIALRVHDDTVEIGGSAVIVLRGEVDL
jgi:predicted PhzF superfamily epimerase YddE/YHI9